jgi:hypothetical protein
LQAGDGAQRRQGHDGVSLRIDIAFGKREQDATTPEPGRRKVGWPRLDSTTRIVLWGRAVPCGVPA